MPLILPPRPPQSSPSLVSDSINHGDSDQTQANTAPESMSVSKKRTLEDAAETAPEPKRKRVYKKRANKPQAPLPTPEIQTSPLSKTVTPTRDTQAVPPVVPSGINLTKKTNKLELYGLNDEELIAAQQALFDQSKETPALAPRSSTTQSETTKDTPPSPASKKRKLDEATDTPNEKYRRMDGSPPVLPNFALRMPSGATLSNTPKDHAPAVSKGSTPAVAKKPPIKARKPSAKSRQSPVKKAAQQTVNPLNRYPSVLQHNPMGQQSFTPDNYTTSPANQYLPGVQHGQVEQHNFTYNNYTINPSQHLSGQNTANSYSTSGDNNSSDAGTQYNYSPTLQHQVSASSYGVPNSNSQSDCGQTQPTRQVNGNEAGGDTMSSYYGNPYANTPYSYGPAHQQQDKPGPYAITKKPATQSSQGQSQPVQHFGGDTYNIPPISNYYNSPYADTQYSYIVIQQQKVGAGSYAVPSPVPQSDESQAQPAQQVDGPRTSPPQDTSNNDKTAQGIKEQQEMMTKMGVGVVINTQPPTAQSDISNLNSQLSPDQIQLQGLNEANSEFDISQSDVARLEFGNLDDPLDFGNLDMPFNLESFNTPLDIGRDSQIGVGDLVISSYPEQHNNQHLLYQTPLQSIPTLPGSSLHDGDFTQKQPQPHPQPANRTQNNRQQAHLQFSNSITSGSHHEEPSQKQQQWPLNQPLTGGLIPRSSPGRTQLQQLSATPSNTNHGELVNQQPTFENPTGADTKTRTRREWLFSRGNARVDTQTVGNNLLPKPSMTPMLPTNPQYTQQNAGHSSSRKASMESEQSADLHHLQQNIGNNPSSNPTSPSMPPPKALQTPPNVGNNPTPKLGMIPMPQSILQHQQRVGQNLPPKFAMAHMVPRYHRYVQHIQRLQQEAGNNPSQRPSMNTSNAGNYPRPNYNTGPVPPTISQQSQRGIDSNVPANSGVIPAPPSRAMGVAQTPRHNSPLKSCMKPSVPTKPHAVPPKEGNNPPLKSCMKPLLPPKAQDAPQKAGTNPPLTSGMKPLLPPKPQDVSQKAGINPAIKSGMKPLLPPRPQPAAQRAESTLPPKNGMTPKLPGAVRGTPDNMYYHAQAPNCPNTGSGLTYYPPSLPTNTSRHINGVHPNQTTKPSAPILAISAAHRKALGISYNDASPKGPNTQQVSGHMPSPRNTPTVLDPPLPAPAKVASHAPSHDERASYRGGALIHEVPPGSVIARGYGGSAAAGAGSLRPLDFVPQGPPPGYGPPATTGYVHKHMYPVVTPQYLEPRIKPWTRTVKPPVQRDAFPYFFETLMNEGSVASVATDGL